jgi:hypothetical protein
MFCGRQYHGLARIAAKALLLLCSEGPVSGVQGGQPSAQELSGTGGRHGRSIVPAAFMKPGFGV